jgi:lantibiotic transport system permease protein
LLTSPQPLAQLYISKFLLVQLLVVLFLSSFITSTAIGSFIIDRIEPSLHLFSYALGWKTIAGYLAKSYLSVLSIIMVQFILGLKLKNFIAPIAIGLVLWAMGILFVFNSHSSLANCFPYSYTIMVMFPVFEKNLPWINWMSLIYGMVLLFTGYHFLKSNSFK